MKTSKFFRWIFGVQGKLVIFLKSRKQCRDIRKVLVELICEDSLNKHRIDADTMQQQGRANKKRPLTCRCVVQYSMHRNCSVLTLLEIASDTKWGELLSTVLFCVVRAHVRLKYSPVTVQCWGGCHPLKRKVKGSYDLSPQNLWDSAASQIQPWALCWHISITCSLFSSMNVNSFPVKTWATQQRFWL